MFQLSNVIPNQIMIGGTIKYPITQHNRVQNHIRIHSFNINSLYITGLLQFKQKHTLHW